MKIAICDDESFFLEHTCELVTAWAQQHQLPLSLFRFSNGDDLLQATQSECIDLIILDILMPLLNGIETAKELRINYPNLPIIFLTSSSEFAIDSYDVNAFFYLMKPVDTEKLYTVLDRFLAKQATNKPCFVAKTSFGYCKITEDEIDYLEAQNKYVNIYLINDTVIKIKESFSKCEEYFTCEKGFFKCHRSYIVNLSHISEFSKTEIHTESHATIPISRNSYLAFKEMYFQHMFSS